MSRHMQAQGQMGYIIAMSEKRLEVNAPSSDISGVEKMMPFSWLRRRVVRRVSVWLQPSQPCKEKARPSTSIPSAEQLVSRRRSFTIQSTPISLGRSVPSVKSIPNKPRPNRSHQVRATRPKMRRSPASKSECRRWKNKSEHCKRRTNCSTANFVTIKLKPDSRHVVDWNWTDT